MSFGIKVHGGTNAGIKRPLREPRGKWECSNGHENKGTWARCLWKECNERRPIESRTDV